MFHYFQYFGVWAPRNGGGEGAGGGEGDGGGGGNKKNKKKPIPIFFFFLPRPPSLRLPGEAWKPQASGALGLQI